MLQMGLLHKYTLRNEDGGRAIVVKFELQIYLKKYLDIFLIFITTTSKLEKNVISKPFTHCFQILSFLC